MQTLKATQTELLRVLLSYDVLRISYHPLVSLKILRIKRRMLFIFGEKSLNFRNLNLFRETDLVCVNKE